MAKKLLFKLLLFIPVLAFVWAINLYFARIYLYLRAFKEIKKNQAYKDGWREKEKDQSLKSG